MHFKNILLFFLLVIYSCDVDENVVTCDAKCSAAYFKSIKSKIRSCSEVLSDKVLALLCEKSKGKCKRKSKI